MDLAQISGQIFGPFMTENWQPLVEGKTYGNGIGSAACGQWRSSDIAEWPQVRAVIRLLGNAPPWLRTHWELLWRKVTTLGKYWVAAWNVLMSVTCFVIALGGGTSTGFVLPLILPFTALPSYLPTGVFRLPHFLVPNSRLPTLFATEFTSTHHHSSWMALQHSVRHYIGSLNHDSKRFDHSRKHQFTSLIFYSKVILILI